MHASAAEAGRLWGRGADEPVAQIPPRRAEGGDLHVLGEGIGDIALSLNYIKTIR
jgi:hypothetical protein